MKSMVTKLLLLAWFIGAPIFGHAMDLKDGDKVVILSGQNFEIWSCGTNGYIRLLLTELAKAGIKRDAVSFYENLKTEQMLAQLDNDVIARKATFVVIIPGIADYNPMTEKAVSASFKNNLEAIVAKLKAANIQPVLVTAYASNSNLASPYNAGVAEHNDTIRSLAKEQGIRLIDLVKVIDTEDKVVPFNRSMIARAVVNQMLAGEIMRAMGYSDQEITACRQAWSLEMTPSVSNNTYAKLRASAKASGKDVNTYITEVLHGSVK